MYTILRKGSDGYWLSTFCSKNMKEIETEIEQMLNSGQGIKLLDIIVLDHLGMHKTFNVPKIVKEEKEVDDFPD